MSSSEPIPENANSGCVGPASTTAGKESACAGCPNQAACASGAGRTADPAVEFISDRLALIKHKILVLSGKGGVGKSTTSAQLAFALARLGKSVGLLDIDICGPSIPRMLGLVGHEVHQSASGWSPVYVDDNLGVMSIGFMLANTDDAVIWRGPRKNNLIKQFLTDVDWGALDYLIIDTPPGTSDEHISILQYLKASNVDGAVIVTTPQEVSMADVRKEINFCKKTGLRILGVVENMGSISVPLGALLGAGAGAGTGASSSSAAGASSGGLALMDAQGNDVTAAMLAKIQQSCPELLQLSIRTNVFAPREAGPSTPAAMAKAFGVPYLGSVPMDPNLLAACEAGASFLDVYPGSAAASAFSAIVDKIVLAAASAASSTSSESTPAMDTSS